MSLRFDPATGRLIDEYKSSPISNDDVKRVPYRKGDKWGFSDWDGNILIDCVYDIAEPFFEGLAMVLKNGKYGYIDKTGEIVIPYEFNRGCSFSDGLALVEKNEKLSYINKIGDVIILVGSNSGIDFSDGLARIKKKWEVWLYR